ncbi:glycosyltransferase family 2 protein [Bradyrhizobium diazoefficiens]|nr:glycosyltransferase family A protein [Bradyrhizobium diazoefficiens]MBR0848845.1 glycosyltransferase family 2 protein [Bradyrhizobium diazoefficiens]
MHLKIIVNCGPCEDYIGLCLGSLQAQTYRSWEAFVTIDACDDDTPNRCWSARSGDGRIDIKVNADRRYAMSNLVHAIGRSGARPDDVIVILDGDDWLANDRALERIVAEYREPACWMTYGSWVTNDPSRIGFSAGRWPAYPEGTTNFREVTWLGTAVRSWKKWLWDLVDDRHFRDEDGNYILVTEDQATMLPMLEMSGTDRARHIPDVLMIYNRLTPHACGKVHYDLMLRTATYVRSLPSYARL